MRVREYRPESDGEAAYQIRRLAFGGPREPDPEQLVAQGWTGLVAEDAGRITGFLRIRHYRQFFGGRAVPMGGLASVSVGPHARGAGVASALLDASIERMHDDGFAVSALFASVPPLYRRMGWEQAGEFRVLSMPLPAVPRGRSHAVSSLVRRLTRDDTAAVIDAYTRVAAGVDGMLDRSAAAFKPADLVDADIAVGVPSPDGLAGMLLADRPDGTKLEVYGLIADDAPTARVLLDQVASWAGQLDTVSFEVLDPLVHDVLLALPYRHQVSTQPWMLRVVDLAAAVHARGWPAAAALRPLSVDIEVEDRHAPWQHGRFRIMCEDGAVRCEPGGSGAVRLTARALSAWYAGAATSGTLRRAGLLDGDADAAARLDALTGAPRRLLMADAF